MELQENLFSQSIPDIFYRMQALNALDLTNNLLTGSLPPSIYVLYNLSSLYMSYNRNIASTISVNIGNLINLLQLDISKNHFFGTIPETMSRLTKLREAGLNENFFSKTVPSSLTSLTLLDFLSLQENSFTGNPRFVANMSALSTTYLQNNFFTGHLPISSQQVLKTSFFSVSQNEFSGPLPFNVEWERIFEYEAYDNYFTGSLPHYSRNGSKLTYFIAGHNYLSGHFPFNFFSNCSELYYLSVGLNFLTGAIPSNLNHFRLLNQLNFSSNFLTGSIPEFLGELKRTSVIDFSNNEFTGTVPQSIRNLHYLQQFFLQENSLGGELASTLNSAAHLPFLENLDFSNNQFTGTIPAYIFRNLTSLQGFALSSNCLDGYIPEEICESPSIATLTLDGLTTAPNCRNYIFPGITVFNAFIVKHFMQGSIPPCLFEIPTLQLLHLSGNGLTGTIPNNVTLKSSFVDLSLSHNLLSGTIPGQFQTKLWANLDLSYNKLTGTLNDDFGGLNEPRFGSLYLDVNRLSGGVPSSTLNLSTLSILDGNIFDCNLDRSSLPKHDSDFLQYSCGSDNVNYVLYLWLILAFTIPCGSILVYGYFHSLFTSPKSSIQNIWKTIESWRHAVRHGNNFQPNLFKLSLFFQEVRSSAMYLTLYCLLILLPVFIILKGFFASYQIEYIWEVSGILYSGEQAAITLFFFLIIFVLLFYYLVMRIFLNTKELFNNTNYLVSSEALPEVEGKVTDSEKLKRRRSVISTDPKQVYGIYSLIFVVNLFIMSVADFSYVYIVVNFNSTVVNFAAFGLAVFRIVSNHLLLYYSIPLGFQLLNYSKEKLHFTSNVLNLHKHYFTKDVRFLQNIMLFNNIIIPGLAIIFILPDCFYNALFAASEVTSFYTYAFCYQNIDVDEAGRICHRQDEFFSYSPPFIYSYQCSSKIVFNYVPVYILLFSIVGLFIPLMKLTIRFLYYRYEWTQKYLESFLPAYYKPLKASPAEENSLQPGNRTLFSKLILVVQINSYFTIFATFGALFPPLAVIACCTIYSLTYFEELSIGWLLVESRKVNYTWYENQLNKEAQGIEKVSNFTIWSMLSVSCFLFGYILFDTMGDTLGWGLALPMTIMLIVVPFVLYLVHNNYYKWKWGTQPLKIIELIPVFRFQSTQSTLANNEGSAPPEENLNSVITENPLNKEISDCEVADDIQG
jgi:Leucine-rich repeat (LRR) protein